MPSCNAVGLGEKLTILTYTVFLPICSHEVADLIGASTHRAGRSFSPCVRTQKLQRNLEDEENPMIWQTQKMKLMNCEKLEAKLLKVHHGMYWERSQNPCWSPWWTSWTTWMAEELSTCESSHKMGRRIGCCWLDC